MPVPLRILLIEDDDDSRELMADFLSDVLGHEVVATGYGAEGIRQAAAQAFDLVITDIGLPDGDGWTVARAIRAANPAARIYVVTGGGPRHAEQAHACRDAITDVLLKPVSLDALIALTSLDS